MPAAPVRVDKPRLTPSATDGAPTACFADWPGSNRHTVWLARVRPRGVRAGLRHTETPKAENLKKQGIDDLCRPGLGVEVRRPPQRTSRPTRARGPPLEIWRIIDKYLQVVLPGGFRLKVDGAYAQASNTLGKRPRDGIAYGKADNGNAKIGEDG